MPSVTFTIPGKPVPQERRVHIRGGWAYDPPKSRKAKQVVKLFALQARPRAFQVSDRSFSVNIFFYGPHWGADLDNLQKMVWDGMKGVFWKDDHQITRSYAQKVRCQKGEERTVVTIDELGPEALDVFEKSHRIGTGE
jgi:Holliday junction resolvase RusA-like endonuclease